MSVSCIGNTLLLFEASRVFQSKVKANCFWHSDADDRNVKQTLAMGNTIGTTQFLTADETQSG